MACLSSIHHAIARLQAVSSSLPPPSPELACIGPLRCPFDRKIQAYAQFRRPPASTSIHSALRSKLLVFAAAAATGQDTATSTLVLQEADFVWKGEGSQVLLTGDFLDWETKVSLSKGADGFFHFKQKLSPGTYKYKYIIDGEWAHSPDSPTIPDGQGGFNNQITITDGSSASANLPNSKISAEGASLTASSKDTTDGAAAKASANIQGSPKAASKPTPAVNPARKVSVNKPYPQIIIEDVVPKIKSNLQKEQDISDVEVVFQDNQLEGSFVKKGIIYTFWAFFPDGKLEGSRGFSLSSHGSPPSTVEPFLIDEKKITADLLIFWVMKRLFAQNLLALN